MSLSEMLPKKLINTWLESKEGIIASLNQRRKPYLPTLVGKRVIIRPITRKDIQKICQWLGDDGTMRFILTYFPQTIQASCRLEDIEFDEADAYGTNQVFGVEIKEKKELIGTMGLYDIHFGDGRAYTRTLFGERSYQRGGYGTEAKLHLLKYAFDTLRLRLICGNVHGTHTVSYMYNNNCGYQIECVRKKHSVVGGRLTDWLEMYVTRDMWEPKWREYQRKGFTDKEKKK